MTETIISASYEAPVVPNGTKSRDSEALCGGAEHKTTNVHSEQADPASVLSFWHRLAELRGLGLIGLVADLERVVLDDQVWAYRVGGVTTVVNLSSTPAKVDLGTGTSWAVLVSAAPGPQRAEVSGEMVLEPWEALVLSPDPV